MTRSVILALSIAALAGCTRETPGYPSLAPRPIERTSFAEPARPVAVATPDAVLDAAVAARGADLDRIVAGFDAAATAADRGVDKPGARTVGSDAWLDAQAALARLDDWRSQASALAAAIEAIGAERAARLAPAYPALDTLAARAAAETDRETAATAALQSRLPTA